MSPVTTILRAEAQAREEHLHLLRRRVLGLVEDHKRVVECAASHERERRDLDHSALDVLRDFLGVEHVVQRVEQWPQVRVDLRHQVTRQEAEPLARLDRGAREDDPVTSRRRAPQLPSATARNVLPVPAGPIPKVMVLRRTESTYRFWLTVRGATGGPGGSRSHPREPSRQARWPRSRRPRRSIVAGPSSWPRSASSRSSATTCSPARTSRSPPSKERMLPRRRTSQSRWASSTRSTAS